MVEIGTEVMEIEQDPDGKVVKVRATAWEPKDGLMVDTDVEVDQLMESRARARALLAAGVKESLMGAIDMVVSGDPERLTQITKKDIVATRYKNVYKRMELTVFVNQ